MPRQSSRYSPRTAEMHSFFILSITYLCMLTGGQSGSESAWKFLRDGFGLERGGVSRKVIGEICLFSASPYIRRAEVSPFVPTEPV